MTLRRACHQRVVIANGWKNDYQFMAYEHGCDWDVVICNNGHVSIAYSNIGDARNMLKDW